jgi:hypothetical protein
VNLESYRNSPIEQTRVSSLLRLVPEGTRSCVDIGARDGFISCLLADRVDQVTALDLEQPRIDDNRIRCVQGNAEALAFRDDEIDLVFCAEVLEHVPSPILEKACGEMARVARSHVLIGVPYKQDTRLGRTTCRNCGAKNPPWGHVNSFDEQRLHRLFPGLEPEAVEFVGQAESPTNALSVWLMDRAGNPYGTYDQDERCVHCGAGLKAPAARTLPQRLYTRAAVLTRVALNRWAAPHANWIHVLYRKPDGVTL